MKSTRLIIYGLLAIGISTVLYIWSITPSSPSTNAKESKSIPVFGYEVVNTYPHDTSSFTQGLILENGILYESTGLNGRSEIKILDLDSGDIIKSKKLPKRYFGEGIAIVDDKLIQLTWRAKRGFVYNKETLERIGSFGYNTQGWGITYDGKHLIMSDGSDELYFLDPKSFKLKGELEVYSDKGKVSKLNELEFIDGEIYANIWGRDLIARINPKTGYVNSWIDLSGLLDKKDRNGKEDVLNGIAYNAENNTLLVTGKLWPKIFEIKIVDNK